MVAASPLNTDDFLHALRISLLAAPREASLSNLRNAIDVFDFVECYDTTIHDAPARHVARIHRRKVLFQLDPVPNWLRPALESL